MWLTLSGENIRLCFSKTHLRLTLLATGVEGNDEGATGVVESSTPSLLKVFEQTATGHPGLDHRADLDRLWLWTDIERLFFSSLLRILTSS